MICFVRGLHHKLDYAWLEGKGFSVPKVTLFARWWAKPSDHKGGSAGLKNWTNGGQAGKRTSISQRKVDQNTFPFLNPYTEIR
jgi:hypothetical protein